LSDIPDKISERGVRCGEGRCKALTRYAQEENEFSYRAVNCNYDFIAGFSRVIGGYLVIRMVNKPVKA
jgi:hypothetical protein